MDMDIYTHERSTHDALEHPIWKRPCLRGPHQGGTAGAGAGGKRSGDGRPRGADHGKKGKYKNNKDNTTNVGKDHASAEYYGVPIVMSLLQMLWCVARFTP